MIVVRLDSYGDVVIHDNERSTLTYSRITKENWMEFIKKVQRGEYTYNELEKS